MKVWVKFQDNRPTRVSTENCEIIDDFIKACKKELELPHPPQELFLSEFKDGMALREDAPLYSWKNNSLVNPLFIRTDAEQEISNEAYANADRAIEDEIDSIYNPYNRRLSSEDDLKNYVKQNIQPILETSGKPQLIAEEWSAPLDHKGKGDLVYHFGEIDYVIELKWIDHEGVHDPSRNKRTVKTNNRKKINTEGPNQAEKYGRNWLDQRGRPYNVRAMVIINNISDGTDIVFSEILPCLKKQYIPRRRPGCYGCGDCGMCLAFEDSD